MSSPPSENDAATSSSTGTAADVWLLEDIEAEAETVMAGAGKALWVTTIVGGQVTLKFSNAAWSDEISLLLSLLSLPLTPLIGIGRGIGTGTALNPNPSPSSSLSLSTASAAPIITTVLSDTFSALTPPPATAPAPTPVPGSIPPWSVNSRDIEFKLLVSCPFPCMPLSRERGRGRREVEGTSEGSIAYIEVTSLCMSKNPVWAFLAALRCFPFYDLRDLRILQMI
jgi:hypothetical protein